MIQRYLNLTLLRCNASAPALELEDALRGSVRVLAMGGGMEAGRDPDIKTGALSDLAGIYTTLPRGLHPDLFLLPDASCAPAHAGVGALKCPSVAFVPAGGALPDPGLLAPYSHVLCQRRAEAEKLRSAGLPRARFFPAFTPGGRPCGPLLAKLFAALLSRGGLPDESACERISSAPATAPPAQEKPGRSFVIPVLDESPASPHNIGTLLEDLEGVEGEVLAVFNDAAMAEKYRGHGRIGRYAILSQNAGVGRAWNIGLMMATTPCVFFLNSDLKLGCSGVEAIERELFARAHAAAAGPCGGFTDFAAGRDLYYLDTKRVGPCTLVDQVSGFYFAVKRDILSRHGLFFHPEYLPCYMEEWDLALQLRASGYCCLRVFADDYGHEWGGSTRARREVDCLGARYALAEVLPANRARFLKRWSGKFPVPDSIFLPGLA